VDLGTIHLDIVQADIRTVDAQAKISDCDRIDQNSLRETVAKSLADAQNKGIKSMAFSDLGSKAAGFPVSGAAKIMVQEIMNYKRVYDAPEIGRIVFCINDQEAFGEFKSTLEGYVRHISEKLGPGPYVTVDIIIELVKGIVLIERSNPPYGWALPGGFLDYGESLEDAAKRETKEETNLDLEDLRQFHTYSKPGRDPRFHTVSTVFVAKGKGKPRFGDDAKGLKTVAYEDLLDLEYAFDHKDIIKDYLKSRSA